MGLHRRIRWPVVPAAVLFVALVAPWQTIRPQPAASVGSVVLLDFEADSQFAQLRVGNYTLVEKSTQAHGGRHAARVIFSAVPEGVREYPAVIVSGEGLKVRDLSRFEAIALWV